MPFAPTPRTGAAAATPDAPRLSIAFDHRIFASQVHGGVSRYFARLAGALAAGGDDVRVIAPFHVNAYLGDLPRSVAGGLRVAPTRWPGRMARGVDGLVAGMLTRAFAPDIVHETYYAARPAAPARRRVISVFDMIHELFPESFGARDTAAADKRAAVRRADLILCISSNTERDLVRLIPEAAGKTVVTLLGFDPPRAVAATAARPYLLYVGPRGGYKNFAGLIEALAASASLRELDLVAVGGGAFGAADGAAIAAAGLSGRVRHVNADDTALAGLYAGARAFVYPSLYEGFGIPPLEAMAAGTPVVAMRASSIPEVCGDAAEYADPADPGSLVTAIEAAALDNDRRRALIAAGTQRVALFSWDACAAATRNAYRSLM